MFDTTLKRGDTNHIQDHIAIAQYLNGEVASEMPAYSGQKTVTTAGTEVALAASGDPECSVQVKALTTNTGLVYVGNAGDGTVSSSTGFPLSAGESVVFGYVAHLTDILVDSAVNGEGVAWIVLS